MLSKPSPRLINSSCVSSPQPSIALRKSTKIHIRLHKRTLIHQSYNFSLRQVNFQLAFDHIHYPISSLNTISFLAIIISAAGLRNMIFSTTTIFAAMLAVAPLTANAHAIMANPVPFGHPNSSPLAGDGSNFPCKGVPYDTTTPVNNWPVGSVQELLFTTEKDHDSVPTTAVHGGGSCQISVTTDKAPTKDSKWKVIHSFEGGCPVPPPTGGNYVEGSPANMPPLPFTIPSELPDGDMVMAWTWFNKVGNREMYMSCGPVKVSGGSSNTTAFESLPDMAVANIQGVNTCTTPDSSDYLFPNPGNYVTKGNGTVAFKPLCGADTGAGGNMGAPPAPVAPVPGVPSQAPTPSQAALPPTNLASTLRTIITVTAPSGPVPTSVASAQSPAAAPPVSNSPVVSPSQAPTAPGAAPPAGQACSPDGSIVCSTDGKQFAICNWGKAVFRPVAQGTTCQGGKIAKRDGFASTMRTIYA
jgi:hypothetical protein